MTQVFKLFRLQQLDSQIDQNNQKIIQNRRQIQDQNEINRLRQQKVSVEKKLLAKQSEIKKADAELEMVRIKLDQNQSNLYGGKIKNPKELQDLQSEAAALRRQINSLEDDQLERMIEAEELQSEFDTQEAVLLSAELDKQKRDQTLEKEVLALEAEIKQLTTERKTVADTVPADELQLYIEIRKKKKGIAIAKVVDQTCSACGSSLNATLLQAAKSPNRIAYCETCGRILYAG
jgi:predicted  nucleic acid-binding Zn-ribbon protein